MNQKPFTIFCVLTSVLFLMAGPAPGIPVAQADDATKNVAECKQTLEKKLEDCCEDFEERADRGVKNIEKDLKEGKCSSARKKRDTSLKLIGNDFDKCTLKLGDLGAKCSDKLDKAIEEPKARAEAQEQVHELLKDIGTKLTDCYETARNRVHDAYKSGAAEAGCDDQSGGDN
jgi:hypothetical protein